jgi:hypothetical protein
VIDLRSLKPLDNATIISSCKKTRRAVIVHEAPAFGGFGGEIAAVINESDVARRMLAPVKRSAGRRCPYLSVRRWKRDSAARGTNHTDMQGLMQHKKIRRLTDFFYFSIISHNAVTASISSALPP